MCFPILQDHFILSLDGARLVYGHWTLEEYGILDRAKLAVALLHRDADHQHDPFPDIARSIDRELGYDLSPHMVVLAAPIRDSKRVYDAAFATVRAVPDDARYVDELLELPSSDTPATRPSQPATTLPELMRDAKEAQRLLKQAVCPGTEWASREMDAGFTSSVGKEAARAPRSQEPAGKFADLMYDPGIKSDERVEEKAKFKYEERVEDVRDIARLAAQYFSCRSLLAGLRALKDRFKFVELENRFARPTALGWMDITVIVEIQLADGRVHLGEIQLQLADFVSARRAAHKHYTPGAAAQALQDPCEGHRCCAEGDACRA